MLCTTVIWTGFSIYYGRADVVASILERYVHCMVGGNREGHDCHMLRLDLNAETVPAPLQVTYLISIAFLNFASLPFVIEFQAVKKRFSQASIRLKLTTS